MTRTPTAGETFQVRLYDIEGAVYDEEGPDPAWCAQGPEWCIPYLEATGTIVDDGARAVPVTAADLVLSVADASAREGSDATLDFVVTLGPEALTAAHEVTVEYRTAPGGGDNNAQPGVDYVHTTGTLTFLPGVRRKTVRVPIIDDDEEDSGERLVLYLEHPTGAQFEDGSVFDLGVGTIWNTEGLWGTFTGVPAAHDGASAFTVRLELSDEVALERADARRRWGAQRRRRSGGGGEPGGGGEQPALGRAHRAVGRRGGDGDAAGDGRLRGERCGVHRRGQGARCAGDSDGAGTGDTGDGGAQRRGGGVGRHVPGAGGVLGCGDGRRRGGPERGRGGRCGGGGDGAGRGGGGSGVERAGCERGRGPVCGARGRGGDGGGRAERAGGAGV